MSHDITMHRMLDFAYRRPFFQLPFFIIIIIIFCPWKIWALIQAKHESNLIIKFTDDSFSIIIIKIK